MIDHGQFKLRDKTRRETSVLLSFALLLDTIHIIDEDEIR